MLRRYRKYIIIAFLCLVIFGALFFIFYLWSLAPPNPDGVPRDIVIEKGSGQRDIAELLYNEGLIRNKEGFLLYVQWTDTYKNLQAGTYQLSSAMGVRDIVEKLTEGSIVGDEIEITFPEGLTIQEMDALFVASELFEAGVFEDAVNISYGKAYDRYGYEFLDIVDNISDQETLEGFLFPDTYKFFKDASVEDVVEKMLENYDAKVRSEFGNLYSRDDFFDIMIIASILQAEVVNESDMRIVAGLIQNRVDSAMYLNMDSTIQYVIGESTVRELAQAIDEYEGPYNTYKVKGLPPTPINNPGIQAIQSVLNPTTSDYLYFLTDSDGTAHYAKTYEEHQTNTITYLR